MAPPLGAEHMELQHSPSTWSTACAVADPDAENIGVGLLGYGDGCPLSLDPQIFLNFLHCPTILSVCFNASAL